MSLPVSQVYQYKQDVRRLGFCKIEQNHVETHLTLKPLAGLQVGFSYPLGHARDCVGIYELPWPQQKPNSWHYYVISKTGDIVLSHMVTSGPLSENSDERMWIADALAVFKNA